MKKSWMLAAALAVFALLAAGCEAQKKEAEERGKIPQELVNKAKEAEQKVKDAAKALEEGLANR